MPRSSFSIVAGFFLLGTTALPAFGQEPAAFGQVVTTLPVQATSLLTDATRQWVYAATSDQTITIIDTTSLTVVAVIPLDIQPGFMALSENGALLYVTSKNTSVIKVLDMNLLKVVNTLKSPGGFTDFAAGRDDRLYAAVGFSGSQVLQIDATTGKVQAILASTYYSNTSNRHLAISPDLNTLYTSNQTNSPTSPYLLVAYDVSRPDAVAIRDSAPGYPNGSTRFVTDHSGRYLLQSAVSEGPGMPYHNAVVESSADAYQRVCILDRGDGNVDGKLTFSLDDSVIFQTFSDDANGALPYTQVEMWRSADGARLGETTLSYPDGGKHALGALTVDASGLYLLAVQQDDSDPANPVGVVTVLTTGFGPAQPSDTAKARVNVISKVATTAVGQPPGEWQFTRNGGDLSTLLTVTYTLTGTARKGRDFETRAGIVTFPAGSRHVSVTVVPKGDLGGAASKTTHISVYPGENYRRGQTFKADITINAPAGQ